MCQDVTLSKREIQPFTYLDNVEEIIGRGGNGIVFKAIRKEDKKTCAIKISKEIFKFLNLSKQQEIIEEIKMMISLPHPLIVKILDYYLDS